MNFKKVLAYVIGGIVAISCSVAVVIVSYNIVIKQSETMNTSVANLQNKAVSSYNEIAAEQSAKDDDKNVCQNSTNTLGADTIIIINNRLYDADGTRIYNIQHGDTLCGISAQVLYSVDELAEYNHIKDVNLIYANSVLRIPNE